MKKILVLICLCFSVAFATTPFFNSGVTSTALLVSAHTAGTGPLTITGYNIANPNNSVIYVQFFNAATAGAVTVGTTTPLFVMAVPSNGVTDGQAPNIGNFNLGIVIAATTTPTGLTAPTNTLSVTLFTNP